MSFVWLLLILLLQSKHYPVASQIAELLIRPIDPLQTKPGRHFLHRWQHSPSSCGINFHPLKPRFSCFSYMPMDVQLKSRAPYDHIMKVYPTFSVPPIMGDQPYESRSASQRVMGGNDSLPGEFPWSASLEWFDNEKRQWGKNGQAGFVLNDWLVTAAHLMFDKIGENFVLLPPDRFQIRYDAGFRLYNDMPIAKLAQIILHPQYNRSFVFSCRDVDLALIRLDRNVTFEPTNQAGEGQGSYYRVNAICLSERPWSVVDDVFLMSSYGPMTPENVFPEVAQKLMLIPREVKELWYNRTVLQFDLRVGYTVCRGDSGSPLAFHNADGRFFLAGVHSAANNLIFQAQCNAYLGQAVQVVRANNLNWIKETLSREKGW